MFIFVKHKKEKPTSSHGNESEVKRIKKTILSKSMKSHMLYKKYCVKSSTFISYQGYMASSINSIMNRILGVI